MLRHLIVVAVIFVGATLAWFVLAATLVARTQSTTEYVSGQVDSLLGSAVTQSPPSFYVDRIYVAKPHAKPDIVSTPLDLQRSHLRVDLALDQRRKGLLWFATFAVDFAGTYDVEPVSEKTIRLDFPLPPGGIYDNVSVSVGGRELPTSVSNGELLATIPAGGRPERVRIAYGSHGVGSWIYSFGSGVSSVRDFDLGMHVNFDAIDFPPATLAPTTEHRLARGWNLEWTYTNLISANAVGMLFPQHLQPGPLAQRITLWAPVSLLFYFFVMLVIARLRNIHLHAINYFFLAAAFFAFHLLFAYLVDRLEIELAFAICSIVSMFLTISYLRLVVGLRFAAVEAGLAQLFYLILFSLALFNEGSSGLSITVGAILTLFVTMQATGRVKWSEPITKAEE